MASSRPRPSFLRRAWPGAVLLTTGLVAIGLLLVRRAHDGVDFNQDIRPILNEKCVACHGGVKREAGLSLLFRVDALTDGTDSGKPAIVPGRPGQSELMHRVVHPDPDERMPADGGALTDDEVDRLRRWIAEGAPWADHWAYRAPQVPPLPEVEDPDWVRRDLDRFILARLGEAGLTPMPEADCAILLRRVSLDLVGLPPTLEDVDAFCADPSEAAYEAAVDRLLASPHYGERWAALWLDLARYADSQGYEKDNLRYAWRYRDWVIDAFNRDLPFDRFTIEQLAGDLLPEPSRAQLIATAFHRNTMTNDEGGTDDEEFRLAAVIDRVNTTWEVWQGTTMACVQCHGHPYDPFRHADYYRSLAFFNNTADADRTDEYPVLYQFAPEREAEGEQLLAEIEALEGELEAAAATPEQQAAYAVWLGQLEAHVRSPLPPPTFDGRVLPMPVIRVAKLEDAGRDDYERALLQEYYRNTAPVFGTIRDRLKAKREALRALEPVQTPVLQELPPDHRRRTHVFDRGNWMTKAEEVEPGVPPTLPDLPPDAPANRLGFAQWLVSDENPLTARVTVNRFWEQLFGRGLVETLEDFGTQSPPPSHPALLDHLALRFRDTHDWHVKSFLKELVTSATYRQASATTPLHLEKDPQNRLLGRGPRVRLTAEQIRDQALFVSGLLSEKLKGPSVMPPQPEGLWQNPYSGAKWQTSDGEDRHRRALYTFIRRTTPYPSMITFDGTTREVCVSRRIRTNTPLQALVTLNDTVYVEAAQALARRMQAAATTIDEQLRAGYRRALLQAPSAEALALLRGLYDEALARYREAPADAEALSGPAATPEQAALTVVANAILNLDAFIMKT